MAIWVAEDTGINEQFVPSAFQRPVKAGFIDRGRRTRCHAELSPVRLMIAIATAATGPATLCLCKVRFRRMVVSEASLTYFGFKLPD